MFSFNGISTHDMVINMPPLVEGFLVSPYPQGVIYPQNLLEEAKSRLTPRNHELLEKQVSWPIEESSQARSPSSPP